MKFSIAIAFLYQNQKASVGSIAQRGQRISTETARAGLRFENNAIVRLGRNSSFLVGSRCVQLQRGRIVVSGSMQGYLGSIVAATRGTIYHLELGEVAGGQIIVIDGKIAVSNLVDPESPPIFDLFPVAIKPIVSTLLTVLN